MADESILINRVTYDFSSCRLNVFGLRRVGFTQMDYADKLERGEGRGASQVALASSDGKYTTDPLKITLHKTSGEELRQHIASQSRTGNSLGDVEGVVVLQFVHPRLGVQTVTCKHCKVTNPGTSSHGEGPDPLTEDWEFYVRLIDRNGITLYQSDDPGVQ